MGLKEPKEPAKGEADKVRCRARREGHRHGRSKPEPKHHKLICHICRTEDTSLSYLICSNYPECRCGFCFPCLQTHFNFAPTNDLGKFGAHPWVCFVCQGRCCCARCQSFRCSQHEPRIYSRGPAPDIPEQRACADTTRRCRENEGLGDRTLPPPFGALAVVNSSLSKPECNMKRKPKSKHMSKYKSKSKPKSKPNSKPEPEPEQEPEREQEREAKPEKIMVKEPIEAEAEVISVGVKRRPHRRKRRMTRRKRSSCEKKEYKPPPKWSQQAPKPPAEKGLRARDQPLPIPDSQPDSWKIDPAVAVSPRGPSFRLEVAPEGSSKFGVGSSCLDGAEPKELLPALPTQAAPATQHFALIPPPFSPWARSASRPDVHTMAMSNYPMLERHYRNLPHPGYLMEVRNTRATPFPWFPGARQSDVESFAFNNPGLIFPARPENPVQSAHAFLPPDNSGYPYNYYLVSQQSQIYSWGAGNNVPVHTIGPATSVVSFQPPSNQ
jgi:hypothetical protein